MREEDHNNALSSYKLLYTAYANYAACENCRLGIRETIYHLIRFAQPKINDQMFWLWCWPSRCMSECLTFILKRTKLRRRSKWMTKDQMQVCFATVAWKLEGNVHILKVMMRIQWKFHLPKLFAPLQLLRWKEGWKFIIHHRKSM